MKIVVQASFLYSELNKRISPVNYRITMLQYRYPNSLGKKEGIRREALISLGMENTRDLLSGLHLGGDGK